MTQFTEAPIFDADQHMYETPESLTKYLPEKYSRAVQFAQIGRQTRIVINNKVNDFIPNPTFERVAAPDLQLRRPRVLDTHHQPLGSRRRTARTRVPPGQRCQGRVDQTNTVGWDKVLFGSDYPHPEGLAEPKGFWKYSEGMDERRTYDFMGDNARRFMGLPIANPDPQAVNPPALANA